MGWASERKAIETRLKQNWTQTPIKFPWAPFEETREPYIACHLINGDRSQITLGGNPTIRSVSILIVQIFIPEDQGMAKAKSYADSLAAIFDRAQFLTDDNQLISCQTASAEDAGVSNGWGQFNVTIPYTRDEH